MISGIFCLHDNFDGNTKQASKSSKNNFWLLCWMPKKISVKHLPWRDVSCYKVRRRSLWFLDSKAIWKNPRPLGHPSMVFKSRPTTHVHSTQGSKPGKSLPVLSHPRRTSAPPIFKSSSVLTPMARQERACSEPHWEISGVLLAWAQFIEQAWICPVKLRLEGGLGGRDQEVLWFGLSLWRILSGS